jgi:hypothetical protein
MRLHARAERNVKPLEEAGKDSGDLGEPAEFAGADIVDPVLRAGCRESAAETVSHVRCIGEIPAEISPTLLVYRLPSESLEDKRGKRIAEFESVQVCQPSIDSRWPENKNFDTVDIPVSAAKGFTHGFRVGVDSPGVQHRIFRYGAVRIVLLSIHGG